MKYAKKMKEVTNIENIKKIYKGFQSIPRHRNLSDIEIGLSGASGQIHSPGYGEEHDEEEEYRGAHYNHYILDFPYNLAELVGTGELRVELEVNTSEQGEYRVGPRFKYYHKELTWKEAEDECVKDGGHLASVTSDKVGELDSLCKDSQIEQWIGGRNIGDGNWSWVSGNQWAFESWYQDNPNGGENQCTIV